jgi:hypothetical protein
MRNCEWDQWFRFHVRGFKVTGVGVVADVGARMEWVMCYRLKPGLRACVADPGRIGVGCQQGKEDETTNGH